MLEWFFVVVWVLVYLCVMVVSFHFHLEKYKKLSWFEIVLSVFWWMDLVGYVVYVFKEYFAHRKPLKPLDWFMTW